MLINRNIFKSSIIHNNVNSLYYYENLHYENNEKRIKTSIIPFPVKKTTGDLLREKTMDLRSIEHEISAEEYNTRLEKIGNQALKLKHIEFLFLAESIFEELGDKDKLRKIAILSVEQDEFGLACHIFRGLGDIESEEKIAIFANSHGRGDVFGTCSLSDKILGKFQEKVFEYMTKKIGYKQTNIFITSKDAVDRACYHAKGLIKSYDIGVELAVDGMGLGYIFGLYGLPIKTVKLSRKDESADFEPIDTILKREIKGKSVLMLELGVSTGRTLKRAVKEIMAFSPKNLDVLLCTDAAYLTIEEYKKFKLLYPEITFPKDEIYRILNYQSRDLSEEIRHATITDVECSTNGLKIHYQTVIESKCYTLDNKVKLNYNMRNIIKKMCPEIRNVITVSGIDNDPERISYLPELERLLDR